MLGVCLLFVGIVLINNGMCTLYNVDGKSTAVMNIFTGGLSLFINFCESCTGKLLCGRNRTSVLLHLPVCSFFQDTETESVPFAWFSTFVAVNAVVFGTIEGFLGSKTLGITPDIRWAGIWYLWAILWGTAFVEDIMGKKLGKFVPVLQVIEGVITAWVPGSDAAPWSMVRIEEKIYAL